MIFIFNFGLGVWDTARAQTGEDEPVATSSVSTGSLSIRLVEATGAPLDSARGRIQLVRTGWSDIPMTRMDGRFWTDGLAEGTWGLQVAVDGEVVKISRITVLAGQDRQVDLVLPKQEDALEMVVVGLTEASELRRSALAITVVETEEAQAQSADLGEVMARTQGVGIRRTGGLGSSIRVSLNGLTDNQVRFFIDGIPLELAGYPFGVGNVPVDIVRRVEVYRGVVPVAFGADALGGAINLVSEESAQNNGASFSYQGGAFDTHRLALQGRAGNGVLRVAGSAYVDISENDYVIDVDIPNERGQLIPTEVRRFHDSYRAAGGALEVGVVDRPWADQLMVRGFGAGFSRDIQHNIVMTIPYGAPTSSVATGGGLVRFQNAFGALRIDAFASATGTRRAFQDRGPCVVDWFGQCTRELENGGEISLPGADTLVADWAVLGRLRLTYDAAPAHRLELSISPQTFSRTGENRGRDPELLDPLTAQRDTTQVVTGLEHTMRLNDDWLENRFFVKHYGQFVRSEEPLFGGNLRDASRDTHRFGIGNALRIAMSDAWWLKGSYELATRLPTPEELFGDAALVTDSFDLVPERSHNVNLGVTLRTPDNLPSGAWMVDTQLFGRFADDLIVLLGNDIRFSYNNVFGARAVGVEFTSSWSAPRNVARITANTTWLDFRNSSDEGTFGNFAGDRIPNRPWLFANASAQIAASKIVSDSDRLTLDWYTRYVHPFFRGWESVGSALFKPEVPAQLSHTVALTYTVQMTPRRITASAEIQNLTDAQLFDFFGVQRPGRAAFAKVTISN